MYISKNWHKSRILHWNAVMYEINDMICYMIGDIDDDIYGDEDDDGLSYLWHRNPQWIGTMLEIRRNF